MSPQAWFSPSKYKHRDSFARYLLLYGSYSIPSSVGLGGKCLGRTSIRGLFPTAQLLKNDNKLLNVQKSSLEKE